jgi:hypothetical protein
VRDNKGAARDSIAVEEIHVYQMEWKAHVDHCSTTTKENVGL